MHRNLFCRSVWLGFKILLYTFVCSRMTGATFDPDNILVSVNNKLREYTPTGALVQTIPFNYGGREYSMSTEFLRGIVVDQYGWVDSYNGTGYPFMTRYSPGLNSFEHKTFPGWSSANLVQAGGITVYQQFVFAADMDSNYATANGIIRFDLFNRTAQRFADGRDFIDVSAGLDGKLYALASSQGDIYVYDPATLQQISHIPKPAGLAWMTSVAADSDGRIFVTGSDRTVSRLSSTGAIEATRSTGFTGFLTDVAVDEKGRVIVAQWQGNVIIGEATLQNEFTSFLVDDYPHSISSLFVSFAHPVPVPIAPVPTPPPTPTPTPSPPPIHDILVSTGGGNARDNALREFTPDGLLLRKIRFNYNGGNYPSAELLRDIVVDHNGVVNAFNGTFAPLLTRFQWQCSAFSHFSFPGWNIVNDSTNGGIGAYNDFIYVTDMRINGDTSGIVRFDTLHNTATRFLSNLAGFQCLTVGLDGKLYATPYSGGLNVYDPLSMQLLRSFPAIWSKVAVDQSGRIFMIDGYGTVSRFDSNGIVESSTATGFPHPTDIDIDETGRLIIAQEEGYVVLGDTTLNTFTWFRAVSGPNPPTINVAFAPLAPAPLQLLTVVSEKEHGQAGIIDIDLPLDGARAVECRSGGTDGDYTMIFTFAQPLTRVGDACASVGNVSTSGIDANDPHRYIVNLTAIPNAVYVVVTLNDVNGEGATHSDTVSQEMGVLIGDSVGLEGAVNSTDISFVKSASGIPVTTSNFRADLNADGTINSVDIALVKGRSGTALPSYP